MRGDSFLPGAGSGCGCGKGAEDFTVSFTFASAAREIRGPVPEARCINPRPTASLKVLMNAFGGHGLPFVFFNSA
jgi:hypothetical protein